MILKEIAYDLRMTDIELAKVISASQPLMSNYNTKSKNGCLTIHLFKIKKAFGDKVSFDKIFSDEKLYQYFLEKNKKTPKINKNINK